MLISKPCGMKSKIINTLTLYLIELKINWTLTRHFIEELSPTTRFFL